MGVCDADGLGHTGHDVDSKCVVGSDVFLKIFDSVWEENEVLDSGILADSVEYRSIVEMALVAAEHHGADVFAKGADSRDTGGRVGGLGVVDSFDIVFGRDELEAVWKSGEGADGLVDSFGVDGEVVHQGIDEADVLTVVIARECDIGRIVSLRCHKVFVIEVVFGA